MKNAKRLEEIFRDGLSSVDVPPAPTQDWAAMARSARQGARTAAVRDRGAVLNARWMRLLGGATAILAIWYFATTPERTGQPPTGIPASSPRAALGEFSGDPARTLAQLMDGPVSPASTTSAQGGAENDVQKTAAPGAGPIAPMTLMDGTINRRTDDASEDASASSRPHTLPTRLPDRRPWLKHSDAAPPASDPSALRTGKEGGTHDPFGKVGTSAGPSSDPTPMPTSADADPTVQSVLKVERTPLPYTPNNPPREEPTTALSFAHWSIAPWFSLGHSTWTAPGQKDDPAIEQLKAGNEMPGSVGLRLQYAFDQHFAVITGIQYARKGGLRGTLRSTSVLSTDYSLSGDYLEVPAALKFTLPLENKAVYLRLGGLLQFNVHSGTDRVSLNDATNKEMSTVVLARGSMGTAVDLGLGAQFTLGRRWALFIEPSYQYALSPVVKHPSFDKLPFNPRIHTFSLATGISFQLD